VIPAIAAQPFVLRLDQISPPAIPSPSRPLPAPPSRRELAALLFAQQPTHQSHA